MAGDGCMDIPVGTGRALSHRLGSFDLVATQAALIEAPTQDIKSVLAKKGLAFEHTCGNTPMTGFCQSVAIGSDHVIVSSHIGSNRRFKAGEIETGTLGGVTQVLLARPILDLAAPNRAGDLASKNESLPLLGGRHTQS